MRIRRTLIVLLYEIKVSKIREVSHLSISYAPIEIIILHGNSSYFHIVLEWGAHEETLSNKKGFIL